VEAKDPRLGDFENKVVIEENKITIKIIFQYRNIIIYISKIGKIYKCGYLGTRIICQFKNNNF
jgi:hypothetical protein